MKQNEDNEDNYANVNECIEIHYFIKNEDLEEISI